MSRSNSPCSLPANPPRPAPSSTVPPLSGAEDIRLFGNSWGDPEEPWDDDEAEEELPALDESELEIEEEPDPDERDFSRDPDEFEDPWN